MTTEPLTAASLAAAARVLAERDTALGRIHRRHGDPPLWDREPGFATLARIILEQQVSLASAAALFARIESGVPGGVTPTAFAATGPEGLRALGVTRQKAAYLTGLAERVLSDDLSFQTLAMEPDESAREILLRIPGVGPWTASIYLLMALRRADVWPPGDLALLRVLGKVHEREGPLGSDEAHELALRWRPWRAVAARMLWHAYLSDPSLRRSERRGGDVRVRPIT